MRQVERLVRLFERIFDRIDNWIDWYRNRQFRQYAIRQQNRGVDTFVIRTGVRSKTPSPIRNLAAFHSRMSEQRYYVEVEPVGWPGSYRQTIGPSFYGYLNGPMDSAGSRWRAEKGRERATTLLKEWKELLEELDFETLEDENKTP